MKPLRTLHALAAILCGAALAAVLLGILRLAFVAVIAALFVLTWSLERLRTDRSRETRP